jgi:hypothetical protein
MKRLPLITLLLLSSLALLSSCIDPVDETQNCNDSPPEYYYLSSAQKAILPYTGYDTISMVSNTGDTIHCIGRGKQYFNTRVFQSHSHPSCVGYGTEKFYEAYKIEFVDSIKNRKIELAHYEYYLTSPFDQLPIIYVSFSGGGGGAIDTHISNSNVYNYIGDIKVNNKLYNSVTKAKNISTDTNTFVYINRTIGVLAIHLNQNERWELLSN